MVEQDVGIVKPLNPNPVSMKQLLLVLGRLMQFLKDSSKQLNYDAVLGTRMAEEQLKLLFEKLKKTPWLFAVTDEEAEDIGSLAKMAKKICEETIPVLKDRLPEYYNKMGQLISENFWSLDYPIRTTNPGFIYSVVAADETLTEDASDNCIGQMVGNKAYGVSSCSVSDVCWDTMTVPRRSRYTLTHEIIFLQVGEIVGCLDQMHFHTKNRGQPTYRQMMDINCANVLQEMKEIAAKGFLEKDEDLFLEQTAICGLLGFKDLFTHGWLNEIISWQKGKGCYGLSSASADVAVTSDNTKLRTRREEKYLQDGCLSHKSAVAVAALAMYVVQLAQNPDLFSTSQQGTLD
ncbi:hypothetical protein CHUAL_004135 [Chamberlinius hualienensis]